MLCKIHPTLPTLPTYSQPCWKILLPMSLCTVRPSRWRFSDHMVENKNPRYSEPAKNEPRYSNRKLYKMFPNVWISLMRCDSRKELGHVLQEPQQHSISPHQHCSREPQAPQGLPPISWHAKNPAHCVCAYHILHTRCCTVLSACIAWYTPSVWPRHEIATAT